MKSIFQRGMIAGLALLAAGGLRGASYYTSRPDDPSALTLTKSHSPVYVADEFMHKTWTFAVGSDGTLSHPRLFAQEGEAGSAVDAKGNVYIAAGNIYIYNPFGNQTGLIEVPERPTGWVFAGEKRNTLFIGARGVL
jgi:sugar lactone lactonase YvrE